MSGSVLSLGGGGTPEVAPGIEDRIAIYAPDGETLEDSGQTIAEVIAAGVAAGDEVATGNPNSLAVYALSGNTLLDSGQTIADVLAAAAAAVPNEVDTGAEDSIAVYNASGVLVDAGVTVSELIAQASVAPPPQIAQDSFLVSGGGVIWTSSLSFRVQAASYYIQGILYNSPEATVTLDAANGSNPRIDLIILNTSSVATKITGTAASTPAEPDVDVDTQLKLVPVLVPTGASTPSGVTLATLYAENAGSPTEWDWTTSGSGFNVNSTTNPNAGSKDIEGTTVAANAYAQAQAGSSLLDINDYDSLTFRIRSKATWASNRKLKLQFYTSGTAKGNAILFGHGVFSFDSAVTNAYQMIVIPTAQFAVPGGTQINQLRITAVQSGFGFYIDDVQLVQGLPPDLAVTALTQAQADARYVQLPRYRKVGVTIDGGGSVISAGIKGSIQVDFAGTIIGWSAVADASGSISVDVCKKAGTQTAPAVPNTTTDKASASAPIALSSAQALGVTASSVSTWTTAVAQWDTFLFNVTGTPATVTRVTIWVRIQETP